MRAARCVLLFVGTVGARRTRVVEHTKLFAQNGSFLIDTAVDAPRFDPGDNALDYLQRELDKHAVQKQEQLSEFQEHQQSEALQQAQEAHEQALQSQKQALQQIKQNEHAATMTEQARAQDLQEEVMRRLELAAIETPRTQQAQQEASQIQSKASEVERQLRDAESSRAHHERLAKRYNEDLSKKMDQLAKIQQQVKKNMDSLKTWNPH